MAGNTNPPTNQPQVPGVQGQPQAPANNLPDHRLDDIAKQLTALKTENLQLRQTLGTVHQSMVAPKGVSPTEVPKLFEEKLQDAVEKIIDFKQNQFLNKHVNPINQKMETAYGNLADQNDKVSFAHQYGSDEKFKQYLPKMEELRQEQIAQGNWVSREQALQLAFFEEEGRKAPAAVAAPPTPEFDSVMNTFVHPGTQIPWTPGTPVQANPNAPAPTVDPQVTPIVPQQVQPVAPVQPGQQPFVPPNAPPADPSQQQWPNIVADPNEGPKTISGVDPSVNPYNQPTPVPQNFGLPNQVVNQPTAINHSTSMRELSENPSEAELAAFESKYGDVAF